MGARVTLLCPLADRAELSPARIGRLTEAVGSCAAFAYTRRSTATFAGVEHEAWLKEHRAGGSRMSLRLPLRAS